MLGQRGAGRRASASSVAPPRRRPPAGRRDHGRPDHPAAAAVLLTGRPWGPRRAGAEPSTSQVAEGRDGAAVRWRPPARPAPRPRRRGSPPVGPGGRRERRVARGAAQRVAGGGGLGPDVDDQRADGDPRRPEWARGKKNVHGYQRATLAVPERAGTGRRRPAAAAPAARRRAATERPAATEAGGGGRPTAWPAAAGSAADPAGDVQALGDAVEPGGPGRVGRTSPAGAGRGATTAR